MLNGSSFDIGGCTSDTALAPYPQRPHELQCISHKNVRCLPDQWHRAVYHAGRLDAAFGHRPPDVRSRRCARNSTRGGSRAFPTKRTLYLQSIRIRNAFKASTRRCLYASGFLVELLCSSSPLLSSAEATSVPHLLRRPGRWAELPSLSVRERHNAEDKCKTNRITTAAPAEKNKIKNHAHVVPIGG